MILITGDTVTGLLNVIQIRDPHQTLRRSLEFDEAPEGSVRASILILPPLLRVLKDVRLFFTVSRSGVKVLINQLVKDVSINTNHKNKNIKMSLYFKTLFNIFTIHSLSFTPKTAMYYNKRCKVIILYDHNTHCSRMTVIHTEAKQCLPLD